MDNNVNIGELYWADWPQQPQAPAHGDGEADEDGGPGEGGHQAPVPGEKFLKRSDNSILAPPDWNRTTLYLVSPTDTSND